MVMVYCDIRLIMWVILKWLSVLLGSFSLCACITATPREFKAQLQDHIKERIAKLEMGEKYKLGYLTSEDLQERDYQKQQSVVAKRSKFGALKLSLKHEPEDDGRLFTFYKEEGRYMAETQLHEKGKKKFFFSFGVDRRNRVPAIGFRIEF